MAVSVGTMARLKNGGAWSFFPGGPETAVEAFGPGVEIEIRTVGEVFDLETLPAVSAPTINQPDTITVTQGTGFTDNMAARVSGGVPPYTFTQVQAAPLPLGVTITAGGNLTGSNQFPVGGYGWSVRVTDSRVTNGEPDPQAATINYLLVVEAVVLDLPQGAVTASEEIIVNNVAVDTEPFSFAIADNPNYSGPQAQVDPAQFALGPVVRVPLSVSVEGGGAAAVGSTLIARRGLYMSLSQLITVQREWLANGVGTGISDLAFVIPNAAETVAYTFREIPSDAAGTAAPQISNAVTVEFAVDPDGWYQPVWKAGPTSTGLPMTSLFNESNGDITVSPGQNALNPRAYFDVEPGKTYELETHVEYVDASRVIGRLSDATGMNNDLNVTVFSVFQSEVGPQIVRTDTFTPAAGRVAMHCIFTTSGTSIARILASTRVREIV